MAKRCVFCGKNLSFFDDKTLLCGNALQRVCTACWAELQDLDQEERAHRAGELARRLEGAYLEQWVGETLPVLFEEERDGLWRGHAPNYVEVLAPGEGLHNVEKEVKITNWSENHLIGVV